MRRLRTLLAVLALLALAGCMTPTYYRPAVDGEGYTEQQLADDHFRVSFSGNSVTSRQTVENYLLYRAAEITLSSGHDYFVMVSEDVDRDVTYRTYIDMPPGGYFYQPYFYRPYFYGPFFYGPGYGMFYDPYFDGFAEVTSQPIEKYRAYATIAVYSGERPADDPKAYDARDVVKRLGPSVLRPPP